MSGIGKPPPSTRTRSRGASISYGVDPHAAADNPFLFAAASPHGTAAVSAGAAATPVGGRRPGQSVSDMNASFTASSPFSFDPLSPSTSIAPPIASPPGASYFDPLASNVNPFVNTETANPFAAPVSQPSLQAPSVTHRASAFDFSGSGSPHSWAPLPTATKSKSATAGADPFASFGESSKSAPSRHDDFGDDFEFAPQALPARDSRTPKSSAVSLPSPKAAAAAAAAEAASASSNKEGRRRSSSSREKKKSNYDSDDDENAEKQTDRRGTNSDSDDSTRVGLTRINALDLMKKGAPFLNSGKSLSDSSLRLRDIEEIRMGQATEIFAKYPAPELAAASMSLMYDNRERSLDIIAKTPYDFKVWSTALHGLVRKARECTDEQMHELREWPIDIRIEPTRVNRSMSSETSQSSADVSSNSRSPKEIEENVLVEFEEIRRRAAKYRERSREQKVYVSEFYRRVQTLLDEVDAMIPRINDLMSHAEWRKADELAWQAGVNLETSKNIMKAL